MKKLKKADLILILVVAVIAIAGIIFLRVSGIVADGGDEAQVVVRLRGEVYGTYPLSKDQEIAIDQDDFDFHNVVKIEDGQAWMKYSNCQNQVCVHDGHVQTTGRLIVCLPHSVSIEIIAPEDQTTYDATAQ